VVYARFRLVPKSVKLNDLEECNDRRRALSLRQLSFLYNHVQRWWYRCALRSHPNGPWCWHATLQSGTLVPYPSATLDSYILVSCFPEDRKVTSQTLVRYYTTSLHLSCTLPCDICRTDTST